MTKDEFKRLIEDYALSAAVTATATHTDSSFSGGALREAQIDEVNAMEACYAALEAIWAEKVACAALGVERGSK
jgi:hypothetical protein